MSILTVTDLAMHFGGLVALSDLNFSVEPGQIVGIIGPNGAGKTTLFNAITGFHKPTRGQVVFEDRPVTGLRPDAIAGRGLVRTWQLVNLVGTMSVFENVLLACHLRYRTGPVGSIFSSSRARAEEAELKRTTRELLTQVGLETVGREPASSLAHGQQRLLGLCQALAAGPKMILLDEPAAGMSAAETSAIMDRIKAIREDGVTVMLVEHDMKVIMNICDEIIVLNFGRLLAKGSPAVISTDEEVIKAYLGFEAGEADHAA